MEIQKPKDPEHLTDIELNHIPCVEIPYQPIRGEIFELIVSVGEILHPMDEDHFIEWIELYNDNILLDTVAIGPQLAPRCIFTVSFMDNVCFRILASCNVHGIWKKVIRVEFV